MSRVRADVKRCLTAMRASISTTGQNGLVGWLRSCPGHDWFVEIDSGSTGGLDAAPHETADLFRSPANIRGLLDAAEAAGRGETAERQLE
jgi:hypothetical protein